MNILDSAYELQVKFAGLLFAQSGVSDDKVEEFSAIAVLHDHIQLFLSFDDFVKLNNIWMSNFLKNFDFTGDSFNIFLVVNFIFLKNFYCNLQLKI